MKKKEDNGNLVKIIYFDEETAIDYININNGGKTATEVTSEKQNTEKADVNLLASIGAKIGALLKVTASVEGEVNYTQYSDSIIKSTISNTVLTDYIKRANNSSNIKVFRKCSLEVADNSLTQFKMYTPYIESLDTNFSDEKIPIDFSKFDYILNNAKGYYEFIAIDNNRKRYIFRFNIKSLKNNYKLTDLIKMDLVYYGIKVGNWEEEKLNVEQEFNFNKIVKIEEIDNNEMDNIGLEVYDIVLAGVE